MIRTLRTLDTLDRIALAIVALFVAVTTAGLIYATTTPAVATRPTPAVTAPAVPAVPVADDGDVTPAYLPDCESDAGMSGTCVTWDEDSWRMVTGYTPYRYITLTPCPTEDGGPHLPCVWDSAIMGNHRGSDDSTRRYLVYAR